MEKSVYIINREWKDDRSRKKTVLLSMLNETTDMKRGTKQCTGLHHAFEYYMPFNIEK